MGDADVATSRKPCECLRRIVVLQLHWQSVGTEASFGVEGALVSESAEDRGITASVETRGPTIVIAILSSHDSPRKSFN